VIEPPSFGGAVVRQNVEDDEVNTILGYVLNHHENSLESLLKAEFGDGIWISIQDSGTEPPQKVVTAIKYFLHFRQRVVVIESKSRDKAELITTVVALPILNESELHSKKREMLKREGEEELRKKRVKRVVPK
jgi:hypothetical protein